MVVRKQSGCTGDGLVVDQRGFAIPAAMFVLVLLSVMAAAALVTATDESRSSRAVREAGLAFFAAEAGLNRSLSACTEDVLEPLSPGDSLVYGRQTMDNGASYTAVVHRVDAGLQRIYILTVRGRGGGPLGGEQMIRLVLTPTSIFPPKAIAFDGDASVPGGPTVMGECGGLHTNGGLDVSGSVVSSGAVSATDIVVVSGTVIDTAGNPLEPESFADSVDVPGLNPLDYCGDADYFLRDGWLVTAGSFADSSYIEDTSVDGWSWDDETNTYMLEDGDNQAGTVCARGNIILDGNPGTASDPLELSLLATGSVDFDGNPHLVADHADNVVVMAGGDVHLNGNFAAGTLNFDGLVYARGHCVLTGNFQAGGQVVCRGLGDPSGAVDLSDQHLIDGNPTVRFGCATSMIETVLKPLRERAWTQELL